MDVADAVEAAKMVKCNKGDGRALRYIWFYKIDKTAAIDAFAKMALLYCCLQLEKQ